MKPKRKRGRDFKLLGFVIFGRKLFSMKKIIHALHLENGPLWNIAFFNLSKHKLNIYKTKFIETVSILEGAE